MTQHLPPSPSFKHLRLEAKNLHRAFASGDPACCQVLRNLHQFKDKTDSEILSGTASLVQMQFALAMEYQFESWHALKIYIESQRSEPADTRASRIRRFAKTAVRDESTTTWLDPIPRYPWSVSRVDDAGHVVSREFEHDNAMPVIDNLYCAMRMLGEDVPYELVGAASGDVFRFAFERRWAQDAEYISDIDEMATACELLGFDYAFSIEKSLSDSLEMIDNAIRNGHPALVWGGESRTWHVVVGIDKKRGVYLWVGGWGVDPTIAHVNEAVSPWYRLEECPTMPIPTTDWYGCVLGPVQAARNALFILHPRKSGLTSTTTGEVLKLALRMNEPRVVERVNFDHRQKAIDAGPRGHDGWKFYFSPWEGTFAMGSEGIREWAKVIERMEKPTDDFEMIHGFDTTFRRQLVKMQLAARFLRWASGRTVGSVKEHLARAEALFREAGGIETGLLRRCWDSCQGTRVDDIPEAADLLAFQKEHPAMIYLIDEDQKQRLGDKASNANGSPWGYRLLPEQEVFDFVKVAGADSLRRIADLRDKGFGEVEKAVLILDKSS